VKAHTTTCREVTFLDELVNGTKRRGIGALDKSERARG
jgi:hypothetical protein